MGATVSNLSSIAGTLGSVVGSANQIAGALGVTQYNAEKEKRNELRAQQDLALAQLQAQQDLDIQQAQQQAALDRQQIEQDAATTEEQRKRALKRAVARQRASFGGAGVGSTNGGSSEAVLLGLFEESEEEKSQRNSLDQLRLQSVEQGLTNRSSLNTLRLTQLQEKQRLQRELLT